MGKVKSGAQSDFSENFGRKIFPCEKKAVPRVKNTLPIGVGLYCMIIRKPSNTHIMSREAVEKILEAIEIVLSAW